MEFTEVVLKRRMVRHFTDEPVGQEALNRILELARHAPSAGFTQGQSFIVVTERALKEKIAEAANEEAYTAMGFHPFISEAPVLVIPCTSEEAYRKRYREPDKKGPAEQEMEWPIPYWHMDAGCSIMVLLLAVVDEGLAAGFVGTPDLGLMQEMLGIPAEVTPMGIIPIGHPAPDVPSPSLKRGRIASAEYVHSEKW